MRELPRPNDIYRHFKGNCYRIITLATHSETREVMVVYQAMYGTMEAYVRPLDMFMSPVDHEKYPEVKQEYRFEEVKSWENGIPQPVIPREVIASVADSSPADTVPMPKPANLPAEKVSSTAEGKAPAAEKENDENAADEIVLAPVLEKFFDADSYEEKLQILRFEKENLTEQNLRFMALSLDMELADGDLDDQYEQVKFALMTRERFECNRLR